jgi:hypothetical protein
MTMVIGGRPVTDPGDEDSRPIRKKSEGGGGNRGSDRAGGDNRGRKDDR